MAILKDKDGWLWTTHEYPDDWVGWNHEPWVPDYLLERLPAGGVFLDVGAHVGRYAVRLSAKAAKVLAVEPFPTGLFATLALNGISNVEVFRCAAWSQRTQLTAKGMGGSNIIVADPDGRVMAEALDDIPAIATEEPIDLVKIDVEGAEAQVVKGMRKILTKQRPILFIEMHDDTHPGVDCKDTYRELEAAGYGYKTVMRHNEQWYIEARHGWPKDKTGPSSLPENPFSGHTEGNTGADEARVRMQWHYQGFVDTPQGGYGYVAKSMMAALNDMGVDYDTQSKSLLFHTVPFSKFSWYPGQRAAILSMWEHTELPPGVKAGLELFDLALPPCKFSADLFDPHVPTVVVPHGIEPGTFYPSPQPRRSPGTLRILAAATNLRKGPHELIEACSKLEIPWELSLKGKRAKEFDPGLPNVHILDGSYEDMREVYDAHDLYVSASRGEGWDLIAWEALACGLPTIVPAHTGYLDWGHLAQGWLTHFREEESLVKVFGDSGNWYVQDPTEIALAITKAYKDYEVLAIEAFESARAISREWTWQHSALRLLNGMRAHGFEMTPYNTEEAKQDFTPLVTIKGIRSLVEGFDVGGYSFAPFLEGVTYRVPGEVARVLQVSGHAEVIG